MTERTKQEEPAFLYKYRSCDSPEELERLRGILIAHRVWFSAPRDFNDPFDCAPVMKTTFDREGMRQVAIRVAERKCRGRDRNTRRRARAKLTKLMKATTVGVEQAQAEAKRVMADMVARIGVFSLSAKAEDVLMWSHYASSHKGACLVFRTDVPSILQEAQAVEYQRERPVIDLLGDRENAMVKALLHKADYWSYEDEWRVIRTGHAGPVSYEPEALTAIIFGARIHPEHERVIKQAAEIGGVGQNLLRAQFDEEDFRLNIVDA